MFVMWQSQSMSLSTSSWSFSQYNRHLYYQVRINNKFKPILIWLRRKETSSSMSSPTHVNLMEPTLYKFLFCINQFGDTYPKHYHLYVASLPNIYLSYYHVVYHSWKIMVVLSFVFVCWLTLLGTILISIPCESQLIDTSN